MLYDASTNTSILEKLEIHNDSLPDPRETDATVLTEKIPKLT